MNKPEKSTLPRKRPIGGMITSSTSDETIFPKATPIITPTAKSTILPRMANSLNSLSTVFLLCSFDEGKRRPGADSQTLVGLSVAGIIVKAEEQESGNQTAQYQQAAPGRQHRTNPEERYA